MNEYKLWLDFETQSACPIRTYGAKIYSEDKSTRPMCLGYRTKTKRVLIPYEGFKSVDPELLKYALDTNCIFVAHKAFFEQCIWKECMVPLGYPEIPMNRWRCTMAKALAHGLPGALDEVCKALGLPHVKNQVGYQTMLKLCAPFRWYCYVCGKTKETSFSCCVETTPEFYTPETAPHDFEVLYQYCDEDIVAEIGLDTRLRDLSKFEQRVWEIDHRINHEGIYLDMPAVVAAVSMAKEHKAYITKLFKDITLDTFNPTQRPKFKAWLEEFGIKIPNTKKHTMAALLDRPDLPSDVADAIKTFREAAKSSLAKYTKMIERCRNGWLREILRYYGAHTGRFTAEGVQTQNMKQEDENYDPNVCIELWMDTEHDLFRRLYTDVSHVLSCCQRGVICAPPGYRLFIGDFKQIEAVILAWLCDQFDKLEVFKRGEDPYCVFASKMYGRPIIKGMAERQAGKIGDLSMGFGGGINALITMAMQMGIKVDALFESLWAMATVEEMKKAISSLVRYYATPTKKKEPHANREAALAADLIKQKWRELHPECVNYWYATERAAIEACETLKPVQCGKVRWFRDDIFLYAKLPSGRCIAYPFPKVVTTVRKNAEGEDILNWDGSPKVDKKLTYYGKFEGKFMRVATYGGKEVENLVQGIARDLLVEAMVRLEELYKVCFHTHDENASYVKEGIGDIKEFEGIMAQRPKWGQDIPIGVDAWESYRYGKPR